MALDYKLIIKKIEEKGGNEYYKIRAVAEDLRH